MENDHSKQQQNDCNNAEAAPSRARESLHTSTHPCPLALGWNCCCVWQCDCQRPVPAAVAFCAIHKAHNLASARNVM